jgi:hypothetical protein
MKKSFIWIMAILSILTFSCKKSSTDTSSATKTDYYQLKVGNHWIFQYFLIDSNGVATPENQWDSVYIEKDTNIRGNVYYKEWNALAPGMQHPTCLRDSSGYLINSVGLRLCSDDNFTDTIYIDTNNLLLFIGYLKMTGRDSLITVPAGTFPSITSRMKVVPTETNDPHPIRYIYDVYVKNIGRIKSHNFFYNGDQHLEYRLVRYKVK